MGLAEEWLQVRAERTRILKDYKDLQAKLVAELGGKPREVTVDGVAYTLKTVQGNTVKWDEAAVIEALTPAQRKRLTVVKIDTDALAAAMKSKELDFHTFGPLRTVEPKDPYVLVTAKP